MKEEGQISQHGKGKNTFYILNEDTFNKLGYKAKINTHTTSYIN